MRIANSLILVVCGCAAAAACGGSSEVSPAGRPSDNGGEGGEATGKGGSSGKGGKGGSSGKGGSGGKGGSSGGDAGAGVAGSAGSAGSGGDAGAPPGTGGSAGADGGFGGEGAQGGSAAEGGSDAGMGGGAAGPGSLRVIVTAPAGSTGVSVELNGPDGFGEIITRTRLFEEVDTGEYSITATLAFVPGPIVSSLYSPLITSTPVTVTSGMQSNVLVTYPLRFGGSGRLWAADYGNGKISAFDAARLGAGSTQVGDLTISLPGDGRLSQVIAFDSEGNAWIGDCGSAADIVKVGPASLSGTGNVTPEPDVVLAPPAEVWADCVVAIDFDGDGNLYAAHFNGHVLKYTTDQLDSSASAPSAVLGSPNFGQIQDIEFDAGGNLWVSAYGSNAISKLTPDQLESSDETIVPATAWLISEPEGLALGPDGNLWVATYNNHVRAYDPSATTTPTPARDIALPAGFGPVGITFDESGNLWATSYNLGKVARFNAADLTSDGAKTAAYEFTNSNFLSGWSLAFNPAP